MSLCLNEPCSSDRGHNSSQNNEIVDQPRKRAFADSRITVLNKTVFCRVENILGKEEDSGDQKL